MLHYYYNYIGIISVRNHEHGRHGEITYVYSTRKLVDSAHVLHNAWLAVVHACRAQGSRVELYT